MRVRCQCSSGLREGVIKEVSGLLWRYIIIYKEFTFFFHVYVVIQIFNLGDQITCAQNWLPIVNCHNWLPIVHNSIINSKKVGIGLVSTLLIMQNLTILGTFFKSEECSHRIIGIELVWFSPIVHIFLVIVCQVAFKLDHHVLYTEQLVAILKFS